MTDLPRPLRVHSRRGTFGVMAWFARCNVCDREVRPYMPLTSDFHVTGVMVTVEGARFATASAAGDEARTHLVQQHPTHPLVL